MIRGIIVEDEIRSRDTLRGLLSRYCKNVEIIAEADSYRSGLAAIREQHPDVVFLDIQMPDGSGFKLLEELDEIKFEIIFTTAFDQFAIKAIKYSALDYLLKPIDPEELVSALKKVENKICVCRGDARRQRSYSGRNQRKGAVGRQFLFPRLCRVFCHHS